MNLVTDNEVWVYYS